MGGERLVTLQPGTILGGRFEVVKCLGAGSMGLVYACRHRELAGQMVAVKVLYSEVARDKVAAQRFRNEIFAAYNVSHPNVVRAYDYLTDGELVAYTMEFVGGGELADWLAKGESLPINDIISILIQMCAGLQAIHDAGIVHRDLKPENILLTEDKVVKIADFGIARTNHGPKLTEHGGVVGTIDYVSPEYMLNCQVDWRSDIYAVGILGYEMVTGQAPFRGDSVYETMTKRLNSEPRRPSAWRHDCPPELERIILKAMAKEPEERYQSAAEICMALQPLASEDRPGLRAALNVHANRSFVGPVVSAGGKSQQDRNIDGWGVACGYEPNDDNGQVREETVIRQPRHDSGATKEYHLGYRQEFRSGSRDGTEVIDFASQYQSNSAMEPVKLERILSGPHEEKSWGVGRGVGQVITNTSSIDESRLRRLSSLVEQVERSPWIDWVTLLVAVIIGVAIGFLLVKGLFPELMAGYELAF